MKKTYLIGLAMLAVFAFGAIAASSAFAVAGEWLINGAAVTTLTSTEAAGLLSLVNESFIGTAHIDCEGVLDGSVGATGEDETTEVLFGGVKIPGGQRLGGSETGYLTAGTGLDCLTTNSSAGCGATSSLAEVWPINLPWLSQIEAGTNVDDVFGTPEMEPGYDVICTATGISSECEGLASLTLTNEAAGVLGLSNPAVLQKCNVGTGFLEEGGLIKTLTGTLSVS